MRHRWLTFVAAMALVAGACGGDSGEAETTTAATEASTTTAAETTTTTAAETTTTAGTTSTTEAETTTTVAAGPQNVNVLLTEWLIELSAPLAAGTITFDIMNNGEFNHEFIVLRATSYEELPKTSNGAVDEGALDPDAVVDRIFALEAGQANSLTVDLDAGDYVLLCNISFGPNSHAANGQVLSVTVAP